MTKKFSVVMATLNSERTIEKALRAIRTQDYPQELVEILVIDGGSTDRTRETAQRFNCRILDNPEVVPLSAKLIGLREATGDYLMHVDSDEILQDSRALQKRAKAFQENPGVVIVSPTGYANPPGSPFAARYINEFGDPFSMFYYRLSKDQRFFLDSLRRECAVKKETSDYVVFELQDREQPIVEIAAMASVIDLKFFRTNFSELLQDPFGLVHFFYHMQKFTKLFAVTKGDPVVHFSAEHLNGFLRKIHWRVRNNVFSANSTGAAGFIGRERFDGPMRRLKKYLYVPYAFLLFPVLLDTVWLMWSRRDAGYWMHLPLTLYTAGQIVASLFLKQVGYHPHVKSYGG